MKELLLKAIEELKKVPKLNIKGKEYATVASRVEIFRKYFPEYSIVTDIICDDEQRVVIKAQIIHNGVIIADGYSEEIRGQGVINTTSAIENCQTSAIGRALAAFGLIGGEYASSFEVTNAIQQQSKPISPTNTNDIISQENELLKPLNLSVIQKDNILIIQGKSFGQQNFLKQHGYKWNPNQKVWYKSFSGNIA